MTNQVLNPPPHTFRPEPRLPQLMRPEEPSLLQSLFNNVRDALFPEKLPPLRVTSRPVPVRSIWEQRDRKASTYGSLTIHALMIAGLIAATYLGKTVVTEKAHEI